MDETYCTKSIKKRSVPGQRAPWPIATACWHHFAELVPDATIPSYSTKNVRNRPFQARMPLRHPAVRGVFCPVGSFFDTNSRPVELHTAKQIVNRPERLCVSVVPSTADDIQVVRAAIRICMPTIPLTGRRNSLTDLCGELSNFVDGCHDLVDGGIAFQQHRVMQRHDLSVRQRRLGQLSRRAETS